MSGVIALNNQAQYVPIIEELHQIQVGNYWNKLSQDQFIEFYKNEPKELFLDQLSQASKRVLQETGNCREGIVVSFQVNSEMMKEKMEAFFKQVTQDEVPRKEDGCIRKLWWITLTDGCDSYGSSEIGFACRIDWVARPPICWSAGLSEVASPFIKHIP